MHICMCVDYACFIYTHTYIHTYIHSYIHIHTYLYVCRSHIRLCMFHRRGVRVCRSMYVCVCACVVYTYTYMHTYVHSSIYIHTYLYIHTSTYIHVCIHSYTSAQQVRLLQPTCDSEPAVEQRAPREANACIHTYIPTCIHTYIQTCTHSDKHTNKQTHIYICTIIFTIIYIG